jgi:hypothetical protein
MLLAIPAVLAHVHAAAEIPCHTGHAMERITLDDATNALEYYPARLDLQSRSLWFAKIKPEAYRDAAFMTPYQSGATSPYYGFHLDDIVLKNMQMPIGGANCHYIFITAFCCSTLLARLLDRVPWCLVLKEPSLLGQISMARYKGECSSLAQWEKDWRVWSGIAIRLLTRTFDPRQKVIIKAADVCNVMCDVLLENDPRSKAILLYVDIKRLFFLL